MLAAEALQQDPAYQQLTNRLNEREQRCLSTATNLREQEGCLRKRLDFEAYLGEYSYQYREKGRRICSEAMGRETEMHEKVRVKNDCVAFYHKSIGIFQENVRDKLRSLVDNIDFSQL